MSLSFTKPSAPQPNLSLLAQDVLLGVIPAIIDQSDRLQVACKLNATELEIFFRECLNCALASNGLSLVHNQPLMEQDKLKMTQFCLMVWDRFCQLTDHSAKRLRDKKHFGLAKLYAVHCHFQLALFESVCWFNPNFYLRDFAIIFYSTMRHECFSFPPEILNVYTNLTTCFNPIKQIYLSSDSEKIIDSIEASLCAIERLAKVYEGTSLAIEHIHQIVVYSQQAQQDLIRLASSLPKATENPDFQTLSQIVNDIISFGGNVVNSTIHHFENKINLLKQANRQLLLEQYSKWQTLGDDSMKQYELANQLLEQSYIQQSFKLGYRNVFLQSRQTGDAFPNRLRLSSPVSNNNNLNQDQEQSLQNKPK